MKISVLTDKSGTILAAQYSTPSAEHSGPSATRFRPEAGQRVHEVDLPAELAPHILAGTLGSEIFKYRATAHGRKVRLAKAEKTSGR